MNRRSLLKLISLIPGLSLMSCAKGCILNDNQWNDIGEPDPPKETPKAVSTGAFQEYTEGVIKKMEAGFKAEKEAVWLRMVRITNDYRP